MIRLHKNSSEIKIIGIDARFFGSKDRGLGRYVENLIRNLEIIDKRSPSHPASPAGRRRTSQYIIFLKERRFNDYLPSNSSFKKALFKDLNKYSLDLMHFTYFRIPIFYRDKFIVTIHDLIISHVSFFKKIAYKIIFKIALKRTKKIIAVSGCTKKDIINHYRIDDKKIEVIYEGVTK